MAKITRVLQKIFGSNANAGEIGKFGSLAEGTPQTTTDAAEIQSLAAYLGGWYSGILGGNSPALQDWNALCHLYARQLAYLFQAGVAEWETGTTYYTGSLCSSAGQLYVSLTDDNSGNAVTDNTKWKFYGSTLRAVTAIDSSALTDEVITLDATLGSFAFTLTAAASSKGKHLLLACVNTGGNIVTVTGNGAENINFANTLILSSGQCAHLFCNGSKWVILSLNGPSVDSSVELDTFNGRGSGNVTCDRFLNATTVGTDVTWADSATNGGFGTINRRGKYLVFFTRGYCASGIMVGAITVNGTGLSTRAYELTIAQGRKSMAGYNPSGAAGNAVAGSSAHCSWSGRLGVGDIVRFQGHDEDVDVGHYGYSQATIVRIGD